MYTIRRAALYDIPLIREMAATAFPDTYASIIPQEQIDYMMEWMYSEPSLQRQMAEEGHVYFIAFREGVPAGYVSVQPESPGVYILQKLYVLPACQGTGLGGLLFRHAVAYVRSAQPAPSRIELHVNRGNRAIQFYEHMGMRRLHTGDFPIGEGYYMNDYIMGIDL